MSIIDQRLAENLQELKDAVSALGESVQTALSSSLKALVDSDEALAYETILNDRPINRAAMDINRMCHAFVALHLPSAGHLRFVASVMRLSIELERVGDYASAISRSVTELREPMSDDLKDKLQFIGNGAVEVFRQAVQAFVNDDRELAILTRKKASKVNKAFEATNASILEKGNAGDLKAADLVETSMILRRLERVADQTMNICEETVFATSGEEVSAKKYNILFVDDTSDGRLEIALAEAINNYKKVNGYYYFSKGVYEGDALEGFMASSGLKKSNVFEKAKAWDIDSKVRINVVVALSETAAEMIDDMPFHSVLMDWQLPSISGNRKSEAAEFRSLYSDISDRMANLMYIVYGE